MTTPDTPPPDAPSHDAVAYVAPPRRRAHLLRYAGWQLRDYLMNQGIATVLVLSLTGYLFVAPLLGGPSPRIFGRATLATIPRPALEGVFAQLLGLLAFFGPLFATNGLVANDRKFGFFRFYFAKPVSPPRFYASLLFVNGLGFLAVAHLLAAAFGMLVQPLGGPSFTLVLITMYLAYGGIGLLVSAVSRFDWLSLVTVIVAAQLGWGLYGDDPGVRGMLVRLLPPVHRASELYAAAAHGAPLPWRIAAWLAGYGMVCFVLGLVVLRFRPLARGS